MSAFKEFLAAKDEPANSEVVEAYVKSAGFNSTEKQIYSLEKYLTPNSNLAKSMAKHDKSVTASFKTMQESLMDIITVWEGISEDLMIESDQNKTNEE